LDVHNHDDNCGAEERGDQKCHDEQPAPTAWPLDMGFVYLSHAIPPARLRAMSVFTKRSR